jgi:hypothetical protein
MDEPDRIQALDHLTNHGLAVLVVSNASSFDRFSLKMKVEIPVLIRRQTAKAFDLRASVRYANVTAL